MLDEDSALLFISNTVQVQMKQYSQVIYANQSFVGILSRSTSATYINIMDSVRQLVAINNTVIVIDHHPMMMVSADWMIDLGSEVGHDGGYLMFEGYPYVSL